MAEMAHAWFGATTERDRAAKISAMQDEDLDVRCDSCKRRDGP